MQAASTLVYDSTLNVPVPHDDAEASSDLVRSSNTHVKPDGRYEKEGKRWLRRKDNSRFVGNNHIAKPSSKDFDLSYSWPRTTFPNPLPPFLSRHVPVAPASIPQRDPLSANAGRYSLSLKGIRRQLRQRGSYAERIILDIEPELVDWLTAGGVMLHPEAAQHAMSPSRTCAGKSIGNAQFIREVHRSPIELIWRIDDNYYRFLLHCVARFHNIVSYSKTISRGEKDIRLTHLLRPNVTRPDFLAANSLDTPPVSDMEAVANALEISEFEIDDTGPDLSPVSEEGEFQDRLSHFPSLPEDHKLSVDTSSRAQLIHPDNHSREHQSYPLDEEYEASVDGTDDDDETFSVSLNPMALASSASSRDWEKTPESRAVSPLSTKPPARLARRAPVSQTVLNATNVSQPPFLAFWHYIYGC